MLAAGDGANKVKTGIPPDQMAKMIALAEKALKEDREKNAAKKPPKAWAPGAAPCARQRGEVMVNPALGNHFQSKDFVILVEDFDFPYGGTLSPNAKEGLACFAPSGPTSDREFVNRLRGHPLGGRLWFDSACEIKLGEGEVRSNATTGDKIVRWSVIGGAAVVGLALLPLSLAAVTAYIGVGAIVGYSEHRYHEKDQSRSEAVCEALIDTVRYGAEFELLDWISDHAVESAGGLGGVFAVFGPAITLWNVGFQKLVQAFKDKGPPPPPPPPSISFKPEPKPATRPSGSDDIDLPEGESDVVIDVAIEGAKVVAAHSLMGVKNTVDFFTDTTAGNVILGTAIGIGILATLPVSGPSLIAYGGVFVLVDQKVLEDPMRLGPMES